MARLQQQRFFQALGPHVAFKPHRPSGQAGVSIPRAAPAAATAAGATAGTAKPTAAAAAVDTPGCPVSLYFIEAVGRRRPFFCLSSLPRSTGRGPLPRRISISYRSSSGSSITSSCNSITSSSSSIVSGLHELLEQQEESTDNVHHRKAPKKSLGAPASSGESLPSSTAGAPLGMSLDVSASFAAAAAMRQKLQQLQQPRAPRRKRGVRAAAAAAEGEEAATAAASGVRLLQPAAVVTAAFRAATNNARKENLWKGISRRLALVAPYLNPHQLTTALHATARVKYRDARLVDTFAPLILKQIDEFSVKDIALVLNALRKLELPKTDTIELFVNQFCFHLREATAQDFALVSNCLSFFYIYHSRFWRALLQELPRVFSSLEPQHAVLILAAFARIDLRDGSSLLLLSKVVKKHAAALQQQQLAVAAAALAKLMFVHPKVTAAIHRAAHRLLDQPDCPFDVQSLCLLLHSAVCFTGASEGLLLKLLSALAAEDVSLTAHQSNKLQHVRLLLSHHYKEFYASLPANIVSFLSQLPQTTPKALGSAHSVRWRSDVLNTLRCMGVSFEASVSFGPVTADIFLPKKQIAIKCTGPHSYYLESSRLTAYALLQKRLLEIQGLRVLLLPHMEWAELRDAAEKRQYLWAFGRLAAASLQQEATTHFEESEGVYKETLSGEDASFALEAHEALDDDEEADLCVSFGSSRGRRRKSFSGSQPANSADDLAI